MVEEVKKEAIVLNVQTNTTCINPDVIVIIQPTSILATSQNVEEQSFLQRSFA